MTTVLAATLLLALGVRNDFDVPPTPMPPPFAVVAVDGATIGSETNDGRTFWTIDGGTASITVRNTTAEPGTAVVRFRLLDGPCGRGQTVEIDGTPDSGSMHIPPGGSVEVTLGTPAIRPFAEATIEIRPVEPPCPPFATDPRSIAFQLYDLQASP